MDSDRVDQLTEWAAQALASGEPLRALAFADQLTSHDPEDVTSRILRAHALLATGSFDEALRESQIAIRLDPENEDAQFVEALAAWRNRDIPEAQRAFRQAVELSGHSEQFIAQYAWFLATERGPRLAVKTAERLIEASPEIATAWAALGLAQIRLHRPEQAEKSLRRALEIDPRSPEAQSAMIRLLKRRGEHRQADAIRDVLMQASKRYSLFIDEPIDAVSRDEESSADVEPKSDHQKRRGHWGPLKASVLGLTVLTSVLALTLIVCFFANYPANITVAVSSLVVSLLLAIGLWRAWY